MYNRLRRRCCSLARSLSRFVLEPPPAFTFTRLGFRFPKSFSYSFAVDEEGVVVEFWRNTTRRRRRREREKRRSELLGFPLFSCFWTAHRLGSMSSQRSTAVARRFRKNLVSLQVLRASVCLCFFSPLPPVACLGRLVVFRASISLKSLLMMSNNWFS